MNQLTLKAARRTLIAAGYNTADISELVRGIKADAWDRGAIWAAVELDAIPNEGTAWLADGDNPNRKSATKARRIGEPTLFEATP